MIHNVFHKISETKPVRKLFWIRPLEPNPHESSFSLDSQPSWPYHLNHKQVLTVAFPSNLILPYIALVKNEGPVQIQADGVEWGLRAPFRTGFHPSQRFPGATLVFDSATSAST